MPSLNRNHQAADLLRAAAKMRLEREGGDVRPVLHLFKAETPPTAAPEPEAALPAPVAIPLTTQRFRLRCLLCQLFARQYPDRAKAAKDYAYSKRAIIHAAFDAGRLKSDVLEELRRGFELQPEPDIEERVA